MIRWFLRWYLAWRYRICPKHNCLMQGSGGRVVGYWWCSQCRKDHFGQIRRGMVDEHEKRLRAVNVRSAL